MAMRQVQKDFAVKKRGGKRKVKAEQDSQVTTLRFRFSEEQEKAGAKALQRAANAYAGEEAGEKSGRATYLRELVYFSLVNDGVGSKLARVAMEIDPIISFLRDDVPELRDADPTEIDQELVEGYVAEMGSQLKELIPQLRELYAEVSDFDIPEPREVDALPEADADSDDDDVVDDDEEEGGDDDVVEASDDDDVFDFDEDDEE